MAHAALDPSVSDRKSRWLGWVEADVPAFHVHEHVNRVAFHSLQVQKLR
jgi:hypothetical protein